jgi:hypothetical protein
VAQIKQRYNVAAGRPYTTRDGQEKKQWISAGRAIQWDDGGISIELTAVPVGNWWDGKLSLFVQEDKQDRQPAQRQQRQNNPVDDFEEDRIPF